MTSLAESLTRIMETQNLACSSASSKPSATPSGSIKILWFGILEAESVGGGAGDAAGVVCELIFQVLFVLGVGLADGIWVRRERVEGQGRDRVAVGGVKIHVLGEAV